MTEFSITALQLAFSRIPRITSFPPGIRRLWVVGLDQHKFSLVTLTTLTTYKIQRPRLGQCSKPPIARIIICGKQQRVCLLDKGAMLGSCSFKLKFRPLNRGRFRNSNGAPRKVCFISHFGPRDHCRLSIKVSCPGRHSQRCTTRFGLDTKDSVVFRNHKPRKGGLTHKRQS